MTQTTPPGQNFPAIISEVETFATRSGIQTSEFKLLGGMFVTAVVLPFLAAHGVTSTDVSNISDLSIAGATSAYALGRSLIKAAHTFKK